MDAVQKPKEVSEGLLAQHRTNKERMLPIFKMMWFTINKKCKVYDIAGFKHAMSGFA